MASHFEEYGFYTDDPPVRLRTEEDLVPYSTIDDPTKAWLKSLENIWSLWKKSATVTQTLREYFDTAPNPYLSTLRILVCTRDFYNIKSKSSLAFTVIEEFAQWIVPHKSTFKECLTVDLKTAAFRLVIKQKNLQLIRTVSDVYEFANDKEQFIVFIKNMIETKKYKDAGVYTEMLQLQCSFAHPEELLLPLVLQNKITIAEDLLKNQPEAQRSFVSYLDDMLSPNNNLQNIIDEIIAKKDIPDIKFPYTQYKSMSKLVARLAKLYNVPSEICPNLNKKRGEGALQFLIHKRYIDGTLSVESWREMAKEAVGSDPSLQIEILRCLANVNDPAEGFYFAQNYSVPRSEWPWSVKSYADNKPDGANGSEVNDAANEESWDVDDNISYYSLNLPRERIQIIDNTKSFKSFLDYGLKNVNIVGIDSEWKPSFSIKKPELALMQIATHTHIYIFDVTTLGNSVQDLWSELGVVLFNNKSILKLGFSLAGDINIFRESLPALSNIRAGGEGYLDLSHVWKKLQKEDNFSFPQEGDKTFTNENLSKLVELCFGQRLNKSDQFSNWERRPLRETQIVYAALDAYCLLEIYDTLAKQCERLGIPFQEVCLHVHDHKSLKSSVNQESQKTKKNERFNWNAAEDKWTDTQQTFSNPAQNYPNQQTSYTQNSWTQSDGYLVKKAFASAKAAKKESEVLYSSGPAFQNQNQHSSQSQAPLAPQHQEQQQQQPVPSSYNPDWPVLHMQQQPGQNLRFACDTMMCGLARQLRKCGIDCLHLDRDPDGEMTLRIVHDQKRVLLTRHSHYYRFKQYLPPNYCFNVTETKMEEQLAEVLHHYNIKVKEADIFSRCQMCNSNEFVYVSKDTLVELFQNRSRRGGQRNAGPADQYNQWDTEDRARQLGQASGERQYLARAWFLSFGTLNVAACVTRYNAIVKLDQLPPGVTRHTQNFYICEHCGKVYWYGSHIERAINGSLRNIIG